MHGVHDLQHHRRVGHDHVHAGLEEKVLRVQLLGERVNVVKGPQLPTLVGPRLDELLRQLHIEALSLQVAEQLGRQGALAYAGAAEEVDA